MNKANQKVLNQFANISLIGIRQAEINYFSSFFGIFGFQCFFLTGIMAGSVSQRTSWTCYYENCPNHWTAVYNISVAMAMSLTAICLLICVFINVFAQGLAIRGQEGSMINALTGMIAEQRKIVRIFILAVFFFQLQMLATFVVLMDHLFGIISAVCLFVIGLWTYRSSLRIYNRFKFDSSKSGWNYDTEVDSNDQDEKIRQFNDLSPDVLRDLVSNFGEENKKKIDATYEASLRQGILNPADSSEKKKTVLSHMLDSVIAPIRNSFPFSSGSISSNSSIPGFRSSGGSLDELLLGNYVGDNNENHHSGYLLVHMKSKSKTQQFRVFASQKLKWKRYFFVLNGRNLYYYRTEESFTADPANPLNARPIDLEGYGLRKGLPEPPFEFSLQPRNPVEDIRKNWNFRCETQMAFKQWTEAVHGVIDDIND
jgi:hypothetical protein